MPSTDPISKAKMSPDELIVCEDVLDCHREYATDLLSDMETICQWHKADSCPAMREGQPCPLCELCDNNGLLGATKRVLETYEDVDKHLKQVRASLGKKAPGRGKFSSQTLFASQQAKAAFLGIVTVGEHLRSQHATWSARLQSIVASLPAPSPRHVNAGSADNSKGNTPPPTHVNPTVVCSMVNPKLSALTPGFTPELSSGSSVVLVFGQCLGGDCRCDASGSHTAPSIPPPAPRSRKVPKSKATRPLATNPPLDCSKKASDVLDTPAQPSADAQTGSAARACDTPSLQGAMAGGHELSGSASNAGLSTQETETVPPSPEREALIVDPRVFHLRAELVRFDVARRALMDWCRAWVDERQLNPLEEHRTGLTNKSTTRGIHEWLFPMSLDPENVELQGSRCTTHKAEQVTTKKLSRREEEATVLETRFNSQEELKERWLAAQQNRWKRPEKRFSFRLKVSKQK